MAGSLDSRKVREWQRRMARFQEAQQSVAEFCRKEGVSAPSFYQWRKRLAQRPRPAEEAAGFRPVRLVEFGRRRRATARRDATARPDLGPAGPAAGDRHVGSRGRPAHGRRPMLTFAPNVRIYLHARPTDMRKSFDGLCALVRGVFQADPLDGSLFLFVNRRGDRIKAMWWDRDGLALFYKRLESGTFEMLRARGRSGHGRDRRGATRHALKRRSAAHAASSALLARVVTAA